MIIVHADLISGDFSAGDLPSRFEKPIAPEDGSTNRPFLEEIRTKQECFVHGVLFHVTMLNDYRKFFGFLGYHLI